MVSPVFKCRREPELGGIVHVLHIELHMPPRLGRRSTGRRRNARGGNRPAAARALITVNSRIQCRRLAIYRYRGNNASVAHLQTDLIFETHFRAAVEGNHKVAHLAYSKIRHLYDTPCGIGRTHAQVSLILLAVKQQLIVAYVAASHIRRAHGVDGIHCFSRDLGQGSSLDVTAAGPCVLCLLIGLLITGERGSI